MPNTLSCIWSQQYLLIVLLTISFIFSLVFFFSSLVCVLCVLICESSNDNSEFVSFLSAFLKSGVIKFLYPIFFSYSRKKRKSSVQMFSVCVSLSISFSGTNHHFFFFLSIFLFDRYFSFVLYFFLPFFFRRKNQCSAKRLAFSVCQTVRLKISSFSLSQSKDDKTG